MKKLAAALLLAALCLACVFPGQAADMNRYSAVFMDTFDTVISLIGFADSQETFDK